MQTAELNRIAQEQQALQAALQRSSLAETLELAQQVDQLLVAEQDLQRREARMHWRAQRWELYQERAAHLQVRSRASGVQAQGRQIDCTGDACAHRCVLRACSIRQEMVVLRLKAEMLCVAEMACGTCRPHASGQPTCYRNAPSLVVNGADGGQLTHLQALEAREQADVAAMIQQRGNGLLQQPAPSVASSASRRSIRSMPSQFLLTSQRSAAPMSRDDEQTVPSHSGMASQAALRRPGALQRHGWLPLPTVAEEGTDEALSTVSQAAGPARSWHNAPLVEMDLNGPALSSASMQLPSAGPGSCSEPGFGALARSQEAAMLAKASSAADSHCGSSIAVPGAALQHDGGQAPTAGTAVPIARLPSTSRAFDSIQDFDDLLLHAGATASVSASQSSRVWSSVASSAGFFATPGSNAGAPAATPVLRHGNLHTPDALAFVVHSTAQFRGC